MFDGKHGEVRQRSVSTNTVSTPHQEDSLIACTGTYDVVEEFTERNRKSMGFSSECEKEVYEIQLLQLQEQLESAMIEKEQLARQLRKFSESSFRKLQDELEAEKQKNKDLQLMISSKRNSKSSLESSADARQASDLQRHGSERSRPRKRENSSKVTEKKSTLPTRIIERVTRTMYEIAEDFTDDSPKESAAEEKDTRVNITILKENVKRFGAALKPYINTVKGIQGLLHWKSAPYTLVVFMVYMYAVWCGWAVQMFILCLIFRHFISYLQSMGMKIKFNFLDHEEENNLKKEDSSLGLSDKINLVVQISKKVQDYLGKAADSLEKIESVLTWRYRPAAQRLFLALCGFFVISVVVNFDLLLCVIGINMGIKLFLINHVYYKFPRIKQKYDSMSRLWTMLPTRQSWEKSHIQSHIDKYVLPDVNKCAEEDTTESGLENIENSTEIDPSDENKAFFQLFCLPASEILLSGWRGGRRCTLVDRRKRGMGAFKNGKLYLTKSFICFERKCIPSKENLLIPLVDIVTVTKSKPFHFMPGSGMAIEVTVKERSFVFGGLLNRDDAYDSIQEHGVNKGLPWATGIPLDESSPCPNIVADRLGSELRRLLPY